MFDISDEAFEYLIEKHNWPVFTPENLEELVNTDLKYVIVDMSGIDSSSKYDFLEEDLFSMNLRSDPRIIDAFKTLRGKMNTDATHLHIIEVSDDVDPKLVNVGGLEWVIDANHSWPRLDYSIVEL